MSTDSYDSEMGSYDAFGSFDNPNVNRFDSGDVCSNGPVSLASGAQVNGSAAGSSVNLAQGSGADVSGSQGTISDPYEFDPVDFAQANVNDNNTIERGPLWAPEFLTPDGDLVVNNGRNITLQAGTYICLLYTSPSPRDQRGSRMPSSA